MPVKLKIYKQKWRCPTDYPDRCEYPKRFDRKKIVTVENFRGFEQMANWLDKNKQHAKKVMFVMPHKIKRAGAIRKVVFDGVDTWVERYGHI